MGHVKGKHHEDVGADVAPVDVQLGYMVAGAGNGSADLACVTQYHVGPSCLASPANLFR